LGGIGGILGVYLGFSFLSGIELFDVFSRILCCAGVGDRGSSRTSSLEHLTDAAVNTVAKKTQQHLDSSPMGSFDSNGGGGGGGGGGVVKARGGRKGKK